MMLRRVIFAVAGLVLLGCDDGDSGGNTLSSGLPPESSLESLNDDDLKQFCEAAESFGKKLLTPQRICTVVAVSFSEDPQSCAQFRDQCLQDPPNPDEFTEEPDPNAPSCEDDLKAKLEGCSATVEELETCQNEAISAALKAFDFSCSDVPLPMPEDGEEPDIEKPESCAALEEKCPQLAEDDGETNGFPDPDPDAGANPNAPDAGM